MSLIAGAALAAAVTLLAFALAGASTPAARSLMRVRVARGVARDDLRARLARLPIVRDWRPVDERMLRLAGMNDVGVADIALLKIGAASLAALVVAGVRLPAVCIAPAAFAAFVAPSEWIARRARDREAEREAALLPLLERVQALGAAGMPIEHALAEAARTESALAAIVREAVARSRLGVPAFDALAEIAARERMPALEDVALELARARRAGRPLLPLLAERREVARLAWRARRLDAASRVDAALSLVLVAAYLPALMLLVVIPLFLGLLRSLEG
jgi:pilus assembly protein TadC